MRTSSGWARLWPASRLRPERERYPHRARRDACALRRPASCTAASNRRTPRREHHRSRAPRPGGVSRQSPSGLPPKGLCHYQELRRSDAAGTAISIDTQPGDSQCESQSTNGKNGKHHRCPPYQRSGPETFPFPFSNSGLPSHAAISLFDRPGSNRSRRNIIRRSPSAARPERPGNGIKGIELSIHRQPVVAQRRKMLYLLHNGYTDLRNRV